MGGHKVKNGAVAPIVGLAQAGGAGLFHRSRAAARAAADRAGEVFQRVPASDEPPAKKGGHQN